MRYMNSFYKPLLNRVQDDIRDHGEAHLLYMTPPTVEYLRDMGYRVTSWDIHTLVSPRSASQR